MKDKNMFRYGGQAVMEGVMMRGETGYSLAVRHTDGNIKEQYVAISKPPKGFRGWPIVRGVFSFIASMQLGIRLINESMEMAGIDLEEENPSRFEIWLDKVLGKHMMKLLMALSLLIGLAISFSLFVFLPVFITGFLTFLPVWAIGVVEGIIKLFIFFLYLLFISKSKEVSKMLAYHGAEHKTIHCYEAGLPLTVENVRKQSRLHKRCGTSFLLIVMLLSMLFFLFVNLRVVWMRTLLRLLFIPLIAGLSYELIRLAGKSDSLLVRMISFPGLMSQKLTTKEPTDDQIEVAITALSDILRKDGKIDSVMFSAITDPFKQKANEMPDDENAVGGKDIIETTSSVSEDSE